MKVLFASRAYESPKVEGGFVLLSDLANSLSSSKSISPYFFSTHGGELSGVNRLKVFSKTGWSFGRQIEFFWGVLRYQRQFDVIHTAHVPTKLNSFFFRLARILGKGHRTRYIQTITALPDNTNTALNRLCWGDKVTCLSLRTQKRLLNSGIDAELINPSPSNERIEYNETRRNLTRLEFFGSFETQKRCDLKI